MQSAKSVNEPCRACGKSEFEPWGDRDGMTLFQCRHCELVFFHPYPTQKQLDEFYNSHYHDKRGYGGSTQAGQLRRQMYELDVKELESIVPVGGKFLDVGCAEGVFLTCLSDRWEKHGIDVSREASARAASKPGITASARDITEMEDGAYDVVHLRGVFEHILYPDEFLAVACRKLKPRGHLVISTTPNIGGPVPKLFRGRYKLILPNEHVNHVSPRTIEVLAARHKLAVVWITFPYFGTPYASFVRDLLAVPANYIAGKQSPPFHKNILSAYLRREG